MNISKTQDEHHSDMDVVFISDDYYFKYALKKSNHFQKANFEFINNSIKIQKCLDKYFVDDEQRKYIIAIEDLMYLEQFLSRSDMQGKRILFIINTPLLEIILRTVNWWVCSKYINLTDLNYIIKYCMSYIKTSPSIRLTCREQEVVKLYAKGISFQGIARKYGVSIKTIYSIMSSVNTKIDFVRKGSLTTLRYIRFFIIS